MSEPLEYHRLANLFPLIEGREFDELVASIGANGLREPVVIFEGRILDGRNRYRACAAAGVDPIFIDLPETENALRYVIDHNLRRRHLTDDQRRMVAARIANLGKGRPGDNFANCEIKREQAAAMLSVDIAGVDRAKSVIANGSEELQSAVEKGSLTVNAAAALAALPVEKQKELIAGADPKAIKAAAKRIRQQEQGVKKERRENKQKVLGAIQLLAPEPIHGCVLEDYEWDFEVRSRETGMDRHAGNHYPTSDDAHTAEEIVKRTAERMRCAAPDCVLGMWCTVPHLHIALEVMRLRGFQYKSSFVWIKDKIGTGYWNRNKHEIFLIGTRGKIDAPTMGTQFESVVVAARGEHSEKPDWQYEFFERHFAYLPKIELNARRRRAGWNAYGLEAPEDPAPCTEAPLITPVEPQAQCQPESPSTHHDATPDVVEPAPAEVPPSVKGADSSFIPAPTDDELEIPDYLKRPLKTAEQVAAE